MRISNALLGLSSILALSACASTGSSTGPAFASDNDCFFAAAVSNWRALDDRNLIVWAGRRNPHHVQLSMRSTNLRSQETIAFADRDGRICAYGGDAIIINGMMPDQISIASVRRLSEGELEEVYIQFGIRRPEIIETPEDSVQ